MLRLSAENVWIGVRPLMAGKRPSVLTVATTKQITPQFAPRFPARRRRRSQGIWRCFRVWCGRV